jgi:hypothetical protein
MARKFKEKNKFFLSLAVQVSARAWHSHLSVVHFVKDQCYGGLALQRGANYTPEKIARQASARRRHILLILKASAH